ncbi:ATP-binding cassette domain-containing protein, partial [Aliarcobacter butzleri]
MIKIKNLNKIFYENTNKEFYALKDINLNIKKSSCVVLKGVSGSGKSTLL